MEIDLNHLEFDIYVCDCKNDAKVTQKNYSGLIYAVTMLCMKSANVVYDTEI